MGFYSEFNKKIFFVNNEGIKKKKNSHTMSIKLLLLFFLNDEILVRSQLIYYIVPQLFLRKLIY